MPIDVRQVAASDLPASDNLLQTVFWAQVKSGFAQQPYYFSIKGCRSERPLIVLVRNFGAGMSLGYVPHGPENADSSDPFEMPGDPAEYIHGVLSKVRTALPKNCVFIRFDLPWKTGSPLTFAPAGLKKAAMDIQPPSTVLLDITGTEDEILGRMKSKTRYNIRLSEKKGVVIREGSPEELPLWYDLYKETSQRDKIAIHSLEYYRAPFLLAEKGGNAAGDTAGVSTAEHRPVIKLFLAYIADICAAGIITAALGKRAVYLYGASSGYKRNYMPAYGLQWHAITWARRLGCETYDLFGIPPEDDPSHPMYGLYRFKTGFGGEIVHRPGSWDAPLKPILFSAAHTAEKLRTFYYKNLRKR